MAIQLNGDGLQLNYPTSTQTSGGKHPYGCVVIYRGSSVSLSGTWAIYWSGGGWSGSGGDTSAYVGTSISGDRSFSALAIRVA